MGSTILATRHGFTPPIAVLPFESQPEYDELLKGFTEEHRPATATEVALIKSMADATWKLRRFAAVEDSVFSKMLEAGVSESNTSPYDAIAESLLGPGKHQGALNLLMRYQALLNRQFLQSLRELRKSQDNRLGEANELAKRELLHHLAGNTERTHFEKYALEMLTDDPQAITRYIDAEANILGAKSQRSQTLTANHTNGNDTNVKEPRQ